MSADQGVYRIRCIKAGGCALTEYGAPVFTEGEELDLMDESVSELLRCADWSIAHNLCTDPSLEIAQRIAAGEFVVVESRKPRSAFSSVETP